MLRIGQPAPRFALPDADMEMVDLASFAGRKNVVLFFYPRDRSPGGAMEAEAFSDHAEEFARCDTVILGVSRDDCLSHAEFRDRHGLAIPLLSDPDGEVCRLYGVLQEKELDGVVRECVRRATFVIDRKGIIRHADYDANPRHHVAEILEVVRRLKRTRARV
ncbi:MAG: peroxiredoxin [Burkholderiales bacterium]|nr:peroxiredoxin [Burkholderiales bacterium]